MSEFELTDDQKLAATLTGLSLTVSAAAGSGKTSVLAKRCAHLVCDAPERCNIDELLVVTFTEAAAAEMRGRIRKTLRERSRQEPHDPRLRTQTALVEHAHISTLHAFCLWLIRRHFMRLELDPNATILDADEATLLLDESIRRVFAHRQSGTRSEATALRTLIQHYGGGREESIAAYLADIHGFVRTLHDGDNWLARCLQCSAISESNIEQREREALSEELNRQSEGVAATAEYVRRCLPICNPYADEMERYGQALAAWQQQVQGSDSQYDRIAEDIAGYSFTTIRLRLRKDPPPRDVLAKDRAKDLLGEIREWFKARLRKRFGLFSISQWREGLVRIHPYVGTLIELVHELDDEYTPAKRARHALDFSDLEQFAYTLLTDENGGPSDIALTMQNKFAHVLVDEYQDINPIQDAILRVVSREETDDQQGNLFCVGDVKQSIYRFRLADPAIFLERVAQARDPNTAGRRITLGENFRSGKHIVAGINRIFERLMTPALAGLAYDEDAALYVGRKTDDPPHAIEVHLIEKADSSAEDDDEDDPLGHWVDVERQAYLIGRRILTVVEEGWEYRDIAVLLRAATVRAEQIAGVLQSMGIPTRADATTGFFAATEISDMLALLNVLDNMQQDIPLAAVMRSGVCGIRFDETDLLAIRRSQSGAEFHHCVRHYPKSEPRAEQADRVQALLDRLARYRADIRRRPLPDVINQIYAETGYPAYAAGRPGGAQRVANLHLLQRRAQQFSRFSGLQSLHGFLRFIERLRDRGEDLGAASIAAEAGNVVRVTTIHNSKGLEFPVVFVANLEKRFNLRDTHGMVTFDRDECIGLPVVEPQRRIRYASLATARIARKLRTQNLAEEIRVLYVALTRARDRLILVGSGSIARSLDAREQWRTHHGPLPELHLLSAGRYTDWLIPALSSLPSSEAQWIEDPDEPALPDRIFHIHLHRALDTAALPGRKSPQDEHRRKACAALEALPPGEPVAPAGEHIEALFDRMDFVYPSLALGSIPSVLNVSDFKRRVNNRAEEDDLRRQPSAQFAKPAIPEFLRESDELLPAQLGTATHLFMQFLDYAQPGKLAEQLAALVARGLLGEQEAGRIDLDAIAWFLDTELGRRAINQAGKLEKEVPFICRIPAEEVDPDIGRGDSQDFVIVRGMVDLLVPAADGFEIVDFKTDRITLDQVPQRLAIYREQVRQYATAMARIWRCPMDRSAVVFLGPRVIESVDTSS